MLNDDLDNEEQTELHQLDEKDWQGVQINAMEWLLAEGSIAVKGAQRNVADLLLGPGGPAFSASQRSWIEQLRRRPLRLYDVTEVLPGVGMHLRAALDTEAPPVMVYEKSGSANVQIGSQIGVRIMDVDGHHEISGAAYPFSRLMNASLLAELHAVVEDSVRAIRSCCSLIITTSKVGMIWAPRWRPNSTSRVTAPSGGHGFSIARMGRHARAFRSI